MGRFKCRGVLPVCRIERGIIQISQAIRRQPFWWNKRKDPVIVSRWKAELRRAGRFSTQQINYAINELDYYESLRVVEEEEAEGRKGEREAEGGDGDGGKEETEAARIEMSVVDGVWQNDRLVCERVRQQLIAQVSVLEDVPAERMDWQPGSNYQVLNLVHPSLYPLVSDRTQILSSHTVAAAAAAQQQPLQLTESLIPDLLSSSNHNFPPTLLTKTAYAPLPQKPNKTFDTILSFLMMIIIIVPCLLLGLVLFLLLWILLYFLTPDSAVACVIIISVVAVIVGWWWIESKPVRIRAPTKSGNVEVNVITPFHQHILTLVADEEDTVQSLKERLSRGGKSQLSRHNPVDNLTRDVPPSEQVLHTLTDVMLDSAHTLSHYGVRNNSILKLKFSTRTSSHVRPPTLSTLPSSSPSPLCVIVNYTTSTHYAWYCCGMEKGGAVFTVHPVDLVGSLMSIIARFDSDVDNGNSESWYQYTLLYESPPPRTTNTSHNSNSATIHLAKGTELDPFRTFASYGVLPFTTLQVSRNTKRSNQYFYPVLAPTSRVSDTESVGEDEVDEKEQGIGERKHDEDSNSEQKHFAVEEGSGAIELELVDELQEEKLQKKSSGKYTFSRDYSWLPSNFMVDSCGRVKIESYINNLHPHLHRKLYTTLEIVFSHCLPLFNRVLIHLEEGGIPFRVPVGDHFTIVPNPAMGQPTKKVNYPKVPSIYRPPDPPRCRVDLRGKRLQVIVKLVNICLTPSRPSYPGALWHAESMKNERIVATAIYYYDQSNITTSRLDFRKTVDEAPEGEYAPPDDVSFGQPEIYGNFNVENHKMYEELGGVDTIKGRALVFPNILQKNWREGKDRIIYQHRVAPFHLLDPTQVGYRKMLVFFLVDPTKTILSTSQIPPQQREWYTSVLATEMNSSCPLPKEILAIIAEYNPPPSWTMDRKEAEQHRLQLMKERKVCSCE